MRLISLLFTNPFSFFVLIIPLLYSVIFHEIAHGAVASLFGDDTAKNSGRLSLNPFVHIDPMGTLALLFVGFGWARPVPVNYLKLKRSRIAVMAVSLAGCITNIIMAFIAILMLVVLNESSVNPVIVNMLVVFARVNIILGAFNLIPLSPLDGSKVLMSILPDELQRRFVSFESYGFIILIFLLFTGILEPVIVFIESLIVYAITFFLALIFSR